MLRRDRAGRPLLVQGPLGVTLVVTVLLAVVAATVGLVIIRATILDTRNEASQSDLTQARRLAQDARAQFEAELNADPGFFLREVGENERTRLCDQGGTAVPVPPGGSWADVCAGRSDWSYEKTEGSTNPVREELVAPGGESPLLTYRVLARSGSAEAGLVSTYRLDPVGRYVAFSASDLRLDSLGQAGTSGQSSQLGGTVYANGKIFLPAGNQVLLGAAQVAAEEGFDPEPTITGPRYYAKVTRPGTDTQPAIRDIREVIPAPLSAAGLVAGAELAIDAACLEPQAPAQNVGIAGVSYSTQLCLYAGARPVDTAGGEVTIPPGIATYLLEFLGDNTVRVSWPGVAAYGVGDCVIRCDVTSLGGRESAAEHSPGTRSFWTESPGSTSFLAYLPASGVIAADQDVQLGVCNEFVRYGSSCDPASMEVGRPVTLVAGSADAPRDVFIGSPIRGARSGSPGAGTLGVVATGSVVFPYWLRAGGSDTTIEAALVALGGTQPLAARRSVFRTLPAVTPPRRLVTGPDGQVTRDPQDPNIGDTLTLRGSVAAPELELPLTSYDSVRLEGDADLVTAPPPWLPGPQLRWERTEERPLTSVEVCGTRTCPGF